MKRRSHAARRSVPEEIPGLRRGDPLAVFRAHETVALTELHEHDYNELALVTWGQGHYISPGGEYELRRGDVFMLHPGMVHGYDRQTRLRVANVIWRPDRFALPLHDLENAPGYRAFFEIEPALRERRNFSSRLTLAPAELERAMALVDAIEKELDERQGGYLQAAWSSLGLLFTFLSRCFAASARDVHHRLTRIDQVMAFMRRNYMRPIRREDLAEQSTMSLSTLNRHFQQATGMTPGRYLSNLRVAKAEELLRTTNASLIDISVSCGFADSNYLCIVFRKHYGTTPHQYRLDQRKRAAETKRTVPPPGKLARD